MNTRKDIPRTSENKNIIMWFQNRFWLSTRHEVYSNPADSGKKVLPGVERGHWKSPPENLNKKDLKGVKTIMFLLLFFVMSCRDDSNEVSKWKRDYLKLLEVSPTELTTHFPKEKDIKANFLNHITYIYQVIHLLN